MPKQCHVRASIRTFKPSYDPRTHAEVRMNIDIEAAVETAMVHFLAEVRAELASKRQSFIASLEAV